MQPDDRIKIGDLGWLELGGKKYVIHDRPGCPDNAVIEEFDGYLRCWACRKPLTGAAAEHLLVNFERTDLGNFTKKG